MAGLIFFKSTDVWGGGERLTISIAEIVKQFQISKSFFKFQNKSKIQNQKRQSIIFSNNQRLIKEARARGLTVEFIDLGPEVARRRDMPRFLVRKPRLAKQLEQLLTELQTEGFDTVVLQSLNERLLITPIAKQLGYRVIWLEFQLWTPFLVKHPYINQLVQSTSLVDKIIVNSRFAKRELVRLGIHEQRIKVLYSYVDTDYFKPVKTNKKRSHNNTFTIVTVARLHREKGIDVLVDAVPKFKSKSLKVKIVLKIVGDGPERKNFERQVKQLGLQTRVRFLGEKTNVLPYLQSADLFVLPTRRDNCPNALLEAMACGLPVISTTVGGIPEIIDHQKNGLLVEANNPHELAQAISTLVHNPRLRSTLALNARKTIVDRFDQRKFTKTVSELFQ